MKFVKALVGRRGFYKYAGLVAIALHGLSLPASGQGCTNAPGGIVSWWKGEGDASDAGGGNNNGTLTNGVGFAAGEVGQAFDFVANDNAVSIPASSGLNVGAGSGFTIEAWINPADVSSGHPIFEWNSGSYGVCFWVANWGDGPPGSLFGDVKDSGLNDHAFMSAAGLLASNTFQHVALTYDRSSGLAALYLNGLVCTQANLGTFTPLTSADAYIGYRIADGGAGSTFAGQIDEVSLYGRALSSNEIQSIYLAGAAGKCTLGGPQLWQEPKAARVRAGDAVMLTGAAQGAPPLTYQWLWNGTNLPGATNTSLIFVSAQPSNSGPYTFTVTNSLGFAVSSNANLQVDAVLVYANNQLVTNSQTFGGTVAIRLQNVFAGGPIFFTLDGSEPTPSSTIYTGPVLASNTIITIRALAYSSDFTQSGTLDPLTISIVPNYSLSKLSGGGGTISLSPSSGSYLSNTTVTATAIPAPGWSFLQWLGDAVGTNNPTSVLMSRSKTIRAIFGTKVTLNPPSGGTTTLNPAGGTYPYGSVVTVSAVPNAGNYFALWGISASGNTNPLPLVLTNPNPSFSALFASVPGGQAALTVVPVGNGRVGVNPRANVYTLNQSVTVTATADTGQSFLGWSGSATGTQNPLTLSVSSNKLIYANFSHGATLSCRSNYEGVMPEGFVFSLTGDVGGRYEVDGSSNLNSWSALGFVTNSYGTSQFTDSSLTNKSRQFYRAVLVP
jgi:hypothetical protein